ncbi:S-adenosyl-L-methionine dependent methyltransferase [Marasmius fiardii PR-910]|nr:S-adenosyl-L-methionine dependent methyltransferase [Marasmius fiardii PR-910]
MHPRNIYRQTPDFRQLAVSYPPLKHFLQPHPNCIDFQDEEAQRCVTEALLHRDFDLEVQLPRNRLCPPVPNRLNYILWIQDIVRACEVVAGEQAVVGVDIGTGASAIYPLLGCRLEPSWSFVVTELDDLSESHAQKNVRANNLSDRVRIMKATATGPILIPLSDPSQNFYFTMCNPPFYSSTEDVVRSSEAKEFGPSAVCTGATVEMITEGGESAFVRRIVEESLVFGTRCKWYTSMLGKLSSVGEVVESLKANSIENYALTEFVQGQTRRWAVGWSFTRIRLPDTASRVSNPNPLIQRYLPPHNTIRQPAKTDTKALQDVLLGISGAAIESRSSHFLVKTIGNTWSRSARRKQLRQMELEGENGVPEIIMICSLAVTREYVEFQWVQGKTRSLFESFCSHVSRKITSSR